MSPRGSVPIEVCSQCCTVPGATGCEEMACLRLLLIRAHINATRFAGSGMNCSKSVVGYRRSLVAGRIVRCSIVAQSVGLICSLSTWNSFLNCVDTVFWRFCDIYDRLALVECLVEEIPCGDSISRWSAGAGFGRH